MMVEGINDGEFGGDSNDSNLVQLIMVLNTMVIDGEYSGKSGNGGE